jgi:8-oxo-dGTP pyrophosphatase MutT (NUDIX family)
LPKARKPKSGTVAASKPGLPPRLQVAALCWRRSRKGLRILLVTSRDTGRWVIPKGWPMRNRTDAEAAAREAYEEAGLRGEIGQHSIGLYTYQKALNGRRLPVAVRVFPLEVREMLRKYPETGQRRIKWLDAERAARRVDEPELKTLIRDFDPDDLDAHVATPAPDA